jgi:hypothetical protein
MPKYTYVTHSYGLVRDKLSSIRFGAAIKAGGERDFTEMRTFWKTLSITLFATCIALGVAGGSLFWWPHIPSSPRPAEGRIYPLNNHGHYTYMNESEHLLWEITRGTFPILFFAFAGIQHFIDPFEVKRRRRIYGQTPTVVILESQQTVWKLPRFIVIAIAKLLFRCRGDLRSR